MSIMDYEVQFNQLSRYASYMVATERDKCRKFEEGRPMQSEVKFLPVTWKALQS